MLSRLLPAWDRNQSGQRAQTPAPRRRKKLCVRPEASTNVITRLIYGRFHGSRSLFTDNLVRGRRVLKPRKATIRLCLLREIVQLFLKLTRVFELSQRAWGQIPSLLPHKPPWLNIGVSLGKLPGCCFACHPNLTETSQPSGSIFVSPPKRFLAPLCYSS